MKLKLIFLLLIAANLAYGQGKEKIHKFKYKDKLVEKPNGIWEFYDHERELEQKYDFTNQRLIFQKALITRDTIKYKVIAQGGDTIRTKVDRPPLVIGGSAVLITVLVKSLRYPPNAFRNGIQGKALISIIIDKDGKPISYKSKNHVGGGIDEEAIRVVKLMPYGWVPATLNGENVTAECIQVVYFKLE